MVGFFVTITLFVGAGVCYTLRSFEGLVVGVRVTAVFKTFLFSEALQSAFPKGVVL